MERNKNWHHDTHAHVTITGFIGASFSKHGIIFLALFLTPLLRSLVCAVFNSVVVYLAERIQISSGFEL
ncbi:MULTISPECIES: hypothetical protein [Legionella]|uniref:Uncharacterized protein n=1 Tax=Legionella drozanskii LLAP-1 TaxID=1212489 RepID=A0A0W0SNI1_9GAMM|nr:MULTISPECIES: hypothetical protein [Legionella]KTC84777.1 hypothetical protein Ldro_2941 [Legionella drozanskii LLAP-1]PJE06624.1 MAG: hypothetical protein CK430_14860 [Legionella sp.]